MTEITTWEECDLEVSKVFYYSCYCADIWYEKGMNAEVLTYEDWCKESEKNRETFRHLKKPLSHKN